MRYVNEPHLHFQNSANIMQGIFFCAVDCFLEIQFRKVCVGYVCFNTSIFLSLLYGSGVQHHALRKRCLWVTSLANAARQLNILRTGISEYIRSKCPQFAAMDCNAEFSEIFQKTAFCDFVNDIDASAILYGLWRNI